MSVHKLRDKYLFNIFYHDTKGRKWRTDIAAGARGNVYDTSCSFDPFYINQWKDDNRKKKMKFIWDNPYYASHIVENGGMTGLYKQNNIVKELTLTW